MEREKCKGEIMDLRSHMFNRNEVIALFIDMDASLEKTDLAFPTQQNKVERPRSSSSFPEGNISTTISPLDASQPPVTRYEVLREALISFLSQKSRAIPDITKVQFAMYGVWEDVMELLPRTPVGSAVIDRAVEQYLSSKASFADEARSEEADVTAASAPSAQPFPFHAVSNVLKELEAHVSSSSSFASSKTAAGAHGSNTFTVVQGIVFLSRASPPPVSASSATLSGTAVPPTGSSNHHPHCSSSPFPRSPLASSSEHDAVSAAPTKNSMCWMDVVCLEPFQLPLIPVDLVRQARTASTSNNITACSGGLSSPLAARDAANGNGGSGGSESVEVDCTVIDPTDFTGIKHRGLAVGATLTKLLSQHEHGNSPYMRRPLHFVELPRVSPQAARLDNLIQVDSTGTDVQSQRAPSASPSFGQLQAKRSSTTVSSMSSPLTVPLLGGRGGVLQSDAAVPSHSDATALGIKEPPQLHYMNHRPNSGVQNDVPRVMIDKTPASSVPDASSASERPSPPAHTKPAVLCGVVLPSPTLQSTTTAEVVPHGMTKRRVKTNSDASDSTESSSIPIGTTVIMSGAAASRGSVPGKVLTTAANAHVNDSSSSDNHISKEPPTTTSNSAGTLAGQAVHSPHYTRNTVVGTKARSPANAKNNRFSPTTTPIKTNTTGAGTNNSGSTNSPGKNHLESDSSEVVDPSSLTKGAVSVTGKSDTEQPPASPQPPKFGLRHAATAGPIGTLQRPVAPQSRTPVFKGIPQLNKPKGSNRKM